jgi:hypothetical protein
LIREEVRLPDSANFETFPYSHSWRTLVGADSFAADRQLRAAGWHMFLIAGELKTIGLGWGTAALRRGANRNSGTIPQRIAGTASKLPQLTRSHFLGFPYVVIRACSLHMQKGAMLQGKSERKLEKRDGDWASK